MTVKHLIDNWFIGCKAEKVFPLMLLVTDHLKHLGTNSSDKVKSNICGINNDYFGNIISIRRYLEVSDI